MANLQYIGARYVPKLHVNTVTPGSYEWEANYSYEALEMVGYLSTAYISRKPVPATVGAPPNNPDYWCSMGSFSAQVQEYMNLVNGYREDMEDAIAAINTRFASVDAAILQAKTDANGYTDDALVTLQAQLTQQINAAIAGVQTDLDDLDSRVDALEHATKSTNAILVGNSWMAGSGSGSSGHGWGWHLNQLLGTNYRTIAQNGGDFYDVGNERSDYPGLTYQQCLEQVANNMTAAQRAAVTDIIYGGGLNDRVGTYNQVKAAVVSCLTAMKTRFPNARQILIPLIGTIASDEAAESFQTNVRNMTAIEAWNNGAAECGCFCANFSKYWFYHRSDYEGSSSDGYHLNDAGYALCAKYINAVWNGADFAYLPYSGGQSYPANVTGRLNLYRTPDGTVHASGKLIVPEGSIGASTILVDDLGEEFTPMVNQLMPIVFFGPSQAYRFVGMVNVTKNGRIVVRGDYGSYGDGGGSFYFNASWNLFVPQYETPGT